MQVARIEAELAPPAALGGIEGKIGAADQLFVVDAVERRDGDADRGADDTAAALDRIGLGDDIDQLLGEVADLAPVFHVRQDDLEFVAAQAAELTVFGDNPQHALGNLLEQFVTRRMPERIVYLLEPVEIDHHHGAVALGRLVGGQDGGEALAHPVAIGQSGQRIVHGQARSILLALPAGGDIHAVAVIAGECARCRVLGPAGNRPPHHFAFGCGPHRQFGESLVPAQHQREGPFDPLVFAMIEDEQAVEQLADQRFAGNAELPGHAIRNIIDSALGIGRPEPAESGVFIVAQQQHGLVHFVFRQPGKRPGAAKHAAQLAKPGITDTCHAAKSILVDNS